MPQGLLSGHNLFQFIILNFNSERLALTSITNHIINLPCAQGPFCRHAPNISRMFSEPVDTTDFALVFKFSFNLASLFSNWLPLRKIEIIGHVIMLICLQSVEERASHPRLNSCAWAAVRKETSRVDKFGDEKMALFS